MKDIFVIKRDGLREPLDVEKIHKVLFWATDGIAGTSVSEIELKAHIQFYNDIKSSAIHETLIKSAADLISEDTPNYQYVAARLVNFALRKEVYGRYEPDHLRSVAKRNVDLGNYDPAFFEKYTDEEIDVLDRMIKHDRDDTFTYVGMEQFRGKYLVKNRVTGEFYETPQILYMMVAATIFQDYPAADRFRYVKDYYDAISNFDISLPTPVMAGVRTPQRQFSSCVLIEAGDSLNEITSASTSIIKYVSQKAGIGVGAGSIRSIGSPIRNGDAVHTGMIPFFKLFQASVKSCSQGGVRGGAATVYYPMWHYEFENLIVLKNNKGTEETRVRHMDYGVQVNRLMYERLLSDGNITLFSPNDVPGLYEAFFNDYDTFKKLYERAEADPQVRKKTIRAYDAFEQFISERKSTGRIYLQNVDHGNTHSSFDEAVAPVRQSNLCAEITLPTKPLNSFEDENGEVALCTLSAINWGNIKDTAWFEKPCDLAVRALDELLSYQKYPIIAAELATENRRPVGIGIINFAHFLAKNDLKYNDQGALDLTDEYAEAWSYYLIKSSIELAKEKGACPLNHETKYSKGIMPIDTRKLAVDELVPHVERLDWDTLRSDARKYGIRNSTLMALMPSETSSQISNATNGIEPPRAFVSEKVSKDGVLRQVVPGYHRLKNKYDLLWDQPGPTGYLRICAVLQKYVDQAISVNTAYNPLQYPNEEIPMSTLIGDLLEFYKYGGKNLYYFTTYDNQGEVDVSKLDDVDGKQITEVVYEDEGACDSCMI